ncbi:MAG: hypothetical protein KC501_32230 [Myxococcales bacterium]|nr:hypothetical protein [Myxococcales bacterium]
MLDGSTTPWLRDLALVGLALATISACGSDEPDDPQQAGRCGEPGSWPLVSAAGATDGGVVGLAGGRVIARATDDAGSMLHAVGTCGESPVALELVGEPLVVGGHALMVGDTEALRVDPTTGATHRAFGPVFREIHDTPAGLLALGIGGKLLLNPDPARAEPTTLFEGAAWLPRAGAADAPAWPHLWTDGARSFALSTAFELVEVPLGGGDPRVVLTEVEEFHVLDEGRVVAWRGFGGSTLVVTELATGDALLSTPQSDGSWGAEQAGRWVLLTTDRGRLLHLDTAIVIEPVDFDPFQLAPTDTDRVLLVGRPNGSPERGYWTIAPDGTIASFLPPDACLEFDSQIEPTGVVVPDEPCDPQNTLYKPEDELVLHPFGGGAPQALGERFGFQYAVLQDGFVLSWDEEPGTGQGELSADSPGTEPVVLADEVTRTPPVVEGLDAYYFQLGRGVQRFTIDGG